jgi:hypothetical protein
VIRSVRWIGLATLAGGCAAGKPIGASVSAAAPGASEPQRDASAAAPAPQSADASGPTSNAVSAQPTDMRDSASVTDAGFVTDAGLVLERIVFIDELPAHISQGRKPAMAWPQRARVSARRRAGRPYHPDPRIVIDVLEATGRAAADLQRTARDAGYWPFRHCYEGGLRRDQDLAGKVSLSLAISTSGQVERSLVSGATLRDKTVIACVAREAREISFPPGEPAASASTEVSLATGDEPVSVTIPVARAEELRRSLQSARPAAQECYAKAIAADPWVGGRIELLFRVDIHGEIVEVAQGTTRLAGSDLGRCVLDAYRGAHLGLPEANHERHFVYALDFETDPMPSAPEPP